MPRPRAALPFALVFCLPVTLPTASSTRPAILSTVPSVLFLRADFIGRLPWVFALSNERFPSRHDP